MGLRSPVAQVSNDTFGKRFALVSLGIGGCLSVGSNAAKTLAAALNKPIVGVHHMVCSFCITIIAHPVLIVTSKPTP